MLRRKYKSRPSHDVGEEEEERRNKFYIERTIFIKDGLSLEKALLQLEKVGEENDSVFEI